MKLPTSSSSRLWVLLALALLSLTNPAHAQTGAGFTEYYVLGNDDHVWRMMERVRAVEGGAFPLPERLNSVISATSTAAGQILYYDHWEDGFETVEIISGAAVPITSITRLVGTATVTTGPAHGYSTGDVITILGASEPEYNGTFVITVLLPNQFTYAVLGTPGTPATTTSALAAVRHQTSTLILGDGNNLNGRVCDWSTDARVFPCTGVGSHDDALYPGTAVSLASDRGMSGPVCGLAPVAPPSLAQIRCSVPTNLAVPTTSIRFGGGDRIFNTGGSLSTAHIQDPGTPLMGGGTELISRELVSNATAFSVPIGQDLFGTGAFNQAYASLKFVSLDIAALDDNTAITVTSPGGGTRSVTLHRGQHYSTCAVSTGGAGGAPRGRSVHLRSGLHSRPSAAVRPRQSRPNRGPCPDRERGNEDRHHRPS